MTTATMTVRATVERDLADEPQSVVRVAETARLRSDLLEYVLTDQLARDLARVIERVVDAAQPGGAEMDKVGIWVSGFFGSGKSHFAKPVGHLLADTGVGGDSARALFGQLLHRGRPADERVAELLQQARTYQLACHLVLFDIMALHAAAAERNVGLTFLRAFYDSLGLSNVIAFAERELELQAGGQYDAFTKLFEEKSGVSWAEEKDLTSWSAVLAQCLAELMPQRFRTTELAHESLELAMNEAASHLNVDGVVDRLLRWLDARQKEAGHAPQRLVFVADEVGAWAGRDLNRIEQVRTLVETLALKGRGRIWLLTTSQEKLSAVVQNAPLASQQATQELLQRLEARFQTNVHLESSEVGTVIEDRVLRKKPSARPALEQLWSDRQQQLSDVAESPGLELGANYPRAERDGFVKDYPFLPYQLQAAADIFGGIRGVKVSSGARSMLKVVFDATRKLAAKPLGVVVSWDQIFDSANSGNEFADEQYLGSQGLTYLASADRNVTGTPLANPSRLLKTLWLVQQSPRIPRTPSNLARLLVDDLAADVLQLERDVEATLAALEQRSYVRQEATTGQWKFLTQDEVTVEQIVRRIAAEIRQKDIRDEITSLHARQLQALFNGRMVMGKSSTAFEYGVVLGGLALKNEQAPVKLRVDLVGTASEVRKIADERASYLDEPEVRWVLEVAPRLDERLRRAIAIERLETDEEYRRVATERTIVEAARLQTEAGELRANAAADVERAFQSGTLCWAGNTEALEPPATGAAGHGKSATARARVEEALRDRLAARYHRFAEGDRTFNATHVDKLFTVPAGERAALDPDLMLFDSEGHVHGGSVLVEELSGYLKASTKTAGQDVTAHFGDAPYGWAPDLLRYVAVAMFLDGKLSAIDRSGKRFDDPRAPGARALFGPMPFRTTRLEVEEEALTPAESTKARTLLTDLGHPPTDGGEIALREATLQLCADLARRQAVVEKAREVELPLPASYDKIGTTLESIGGSGSRVKVVRALLAHAADLGETVAALKRLERFEQHHGLAQYRRSQQLLLAALQAGLADDPTWGTKIQTARDEVQALVDQRRVLDEWDGAFKGYRSDVRDAFKAVCEPLRKELSQRVTEARIQVTKMPEYEQLDIAGRARVRAEFLSEGQPLAEVSLPELHEEAQLLAANAEYSIPHLRTALAAIDSQLGQARARVIELYTEAQRRKGEAEKIATWSPTEAFAGQRFETEDQVDEAFDAERDRLKALVRDGKTIQVV